MSTHQQRGQRSLGVIFISAGLLIFAVRQLNLDFGAYITVLVGLVFLALRFFGGQEWAVYPGAFTTAAGIPVALAASGRADMLVWWPLFILLPGLAFFLIAASSPGDRWALVPGSIVSLLGVLFLLANRGVIAWDHLLWAQTWWPLLLVGIGLLMILRHRRTS